MTKQYILNAIAKNWSVPALRNVYDTIIAFLHDVGLDAEVEGMDTNAQHRMAHRINRRLVLDNPRIPGSKDINDLYTEFMSMMAEHQTKYATLDEMYTDWDYMLKIVTHGMAGYDAVYRRLTTGYELDTVTGYFSMETMLEDRPLDVF